MRKKLADPKTYEDAKKAHKLQASPIKELFKNHGGAIGRVVAIDMLLAVGFYMVVTFISGYMINMHGMAQNQVLVINTIAMVIFAGVIPVSGWLSDRVGRKPLMYGATLGLIAFGYPLIAMIGAGGFWMPLLAQVGLSILMGTYFGVIPAVISEQFPTSVRFSGLSIAHNLSMSIFGGSVPWLMTHMIQDTGNLMVPAFYLIGAAMVSLLSLSFFKDRFKEKLI
jgi:MHS family proline/betaine transporter-like MFS transporter